MTNSARDLKVNDILLDIIAKNSCVKALHFVTLEFAPPLNQRVVLKEIDDAIVAQSLHLRCSLRLPFWDGLMLSAGTAEQVPVEALKAATFHQSFKGKIKRIPSKELNLAKLAEETAKVSASGQLLAVTSLTEMEDGVMKHLPMLDFHVSFSEHATALIIEVLKVIGIAGKLLRSGKSYHFYGDEFLSENELRIFLGKALLFGPIIDRTWVAHQIIEGCCALRISSRMEYGGPPSLVAVV